MNRLLRIWAQHPRRTAGILCILLLTMASLVCLSTGETLRYPDERDYLQLAENLRSGAGFVDAEQRPTAARPPGYPIVLRCLYAVWPTPLAAKLFNAVALALSAWLLSVLVAQVVPEARVFVPFLFLLYPLFLYAGSTLFPQTTGMLLLMSAILGLLRFPFSATAAAGAGLLLGFLILSIPTFLLLLPMVAVALLSEPSRTGFRPFRQVALCLFCAVLVIAPWTLRNSLRFNRFVPISSNAGLNLLLGNSENATAKSGFNVDISRYTEGTAALNEFDRDEHFKRGAVEWITRHPRQAIGLYVRKVAQYFGFRETLFVRSEASALRSWILFFTYYPLLILALVRIALWRRYRFHRTEILFLLFYFSNAFFSAIFTPRIRYRIPYDALLIGTVALFLGRLCAPLTRPGTETTSTPIPPRT